MEQNEIGTWKDVNTKFGTVGTPSIEYPTVSQLGTQELIVAGDYLDNECPQFVDIKEDDRPTIANSWIKPGYAVADGARVELSALGRQQAFLPDVIDGEQYTSLNRTFRRSSLSKVPKMNTENITNFFGAFDSVVNLIEVEELNVSKGENFESMFSGCTKLTSVSDINAPNGKIFRAMFASCSQLKTISSLEVPNGTNFFEVFASCTSLIETPPLYTSNGTEFVRMFQLCSSLVTIPLLDLAKGTNLTDIFQNCTSLTNLKMKNLKESISLIHSSLLSQESIEYIIDNLQTVSGKTINLHAEAYARVTDEYKQKALDRGFSIVSA